MPLMLGRSGTRRRLLCQVRGLGFSGAPDGLQYCSQDYVLLMEKGSVQRRSIALCTLQFALIQTNDGTEQESKAKLDAFD